MTTGKLGRSNTPSEISYSFSTEKPVEKAIIKTLENLTGRPRLIRMARDYEREVAEGRDFWEVMQERYRIGFDIPRGQVDHLPATGPLVCIANHPYGILDGLAMGRLLSMRRQEKDFKIVAHVVFRKAKELNDHILPVSFDETKEGIQINLQTRREGIEYVKNGGAVAIFPGGTVSTPARPFGRAIDPRWKNFTSKLVSRTDAAVVPIFFEGTNSRLFQVASHLSSTLRMGLLIKEFGRRVGDDLGIRIGAPIPREEIKKFDNDPNALMDFLRREVYALSPRPFRDLGYGWNGEDEPDRPRAA